MSIAAGLLRLALERGEELQRLRKLVRNPRP